MKKFLSIAAVIAMIMMLAVPALAADADAPVNYTPSVTFEGVSATAPDAPEGTHVEIRDADPETVNEEGLIAAAEQSANVKAADEVTGYEVVDIVVVGNADGEEMEQNAPIQVAFTYDKASQVIAAFIQNDDGSWSEVSFSVSGDTITLNLPHLTPVALTLGTKKAQPSQPTEPGKPGGPKKSPQTGYNTTLWAIAAAAMVLCAGYCFVSARKKAAE